MIYAAGPPRLRQRFAFGVISSICAFTPIQRQRSFKIRQHDVAVVSRCRIGVFT
jgi:hypothetical protein